MSGLVWCYCVSSVRLSMLFLVPVHVFLCTKLSLWMFFLSLSALSFCRENRFKVAVVRNYRHYHVWLGWSGLWWVISVGPDYGEGGPKKISFTCIFCCLVTQDLVHCSNQTSNLWDSNGWASQKLFNWDNLTSYATFLNRRYMVMNPAGAWVSESYTSLQSWSMFDSWKYLMFIHGLKPTFG